MKLVGRDAGVPGFSPPPLHSEIPRNMKREPEGTQSPLPFTKSGEGANMPFQI